MLFLLKNGLNNSVRGTFPDDCPMIYGAIRYADLNAVKTLKNLVLIFLIIAAELKVMFYLKL
ncbi:MAG: hypothetical protein GXO80_14045 [Chlorobi bacterium]|nr:hypothetical protein [Chlorobiota bacterium]